MRRGRVAWRRDLIIALLLAVLVGVVQLVLRNPVGVVLLSAGVGFVIAVFVLAISDRYSRQD